MRETPLASPFDPQTGTSGQMPIQTGLDGSPPSNMTQTPVPTFGESGWMAGWQGSAQATAVPLTPGTWT